MDTLIFCCKSKRIDAILAQIDVFSMCLNLNRFDLRPFFLSQKTKGGSILLLRDAFQLQEKTFLIPVLENLKQAKKRFSKSAA